MGPSSQRVVHIVRSQHEDHLRERVYAKEGRILHARRVRGAGAHLILWPHRSDVWRCGASRRKKVFTEIIKTIARFQPITVGVNTEDFPAVCEIFDGVENVRVIHMEYNDSDPRPRPGVSCQRQGRRGTLALPL